MEGIGIRTVILVFFILGLIILAGVTYVFLRSILSREAKAVNFSFLLSLTMLGAALVLLAYFFPYIVKLLGAK